MENLFGKMRIVNVILPVNLDFGYDYALPDDFPAEKEIPVGRFVEISLRNTKTIGLVVSQGKDKNLDASKVKTISQVFDKIPPVSQKFIDFLSWVAKYNMSSIGNVFKMVMGNEDFFNFSKVQTFYNLDVKKAEALRKSDTRQKVIDFFKCNASSVGKNSENDYFTVEEISYKAKVSVAVIKALDKASAFHKQVKTLMPENQVVNYDKDFKLSDGQAEVVGKLQSLINDFNVSVINGITGSGKTEVYFKIIDDVLAKNPDGQCLIMLPEIALTGQFLSRFEQRFNSKPVLWHSSLTASQRKNSFIAIATGKAKVVVGTRSALLLPYCDLKSIIVDEEHDGSFKQEEGVIYNARDMAIVRAKMENIPVILSSATCSIETIVNAREGKFHEFHLKSRFGNAVLPDITLADLRGEKKGKDRSYLSELALKKVDNALRENQQVMLFLNRRGYAPVVVCKHCGCREECPNCSIYLTAHGLENTVLKCHHCGFITKPKNVCPNEKCEKKNSFELYGVGVERLYEEVVQRYPNKRICILSSDTLNTTKKLYEAIEAVEKGEFDIIIGTQIFAKGHNFPNLTLVVVVDGDMSLTGIDFRAAEKTFQMLNQVSGRAGRFEKKGEVIIQTYDPNHKVMQALKSGDKQTFLEVEIGERELIEVPPFAKFTGIIVSSKNKDSAEKFVEFMSQCRPFSSEKSFDVLGPAEAPIGFLNGWYRHRFLIKSKKGFNIQKLIKMWLEKCGKIPTDIKIKIDIDPYNFF